MTLTFGGVSGFGRRRAVQAVNRLPGRRVLEMGVGTGLALPHYGSDKLITGIDLSAHMLELARKRVAGAPAAQHRHAARDGRRGDRFSGRQFRYRGGDVRRLGRAPSERLLTEMRRVVRPGGHLLFVGHFRAERGPRWWIERAMAPASRKLGWHPDFAIEDLLGPPERANAAMMQVPPAGLFTLVHLSN